MAIKLTQPTTNSPVNGIKLNPAVKGAPTLEQIKGFQEKRGTKTPTGLEAKLSATPDYGSKVGAEQVGGFKKIWDSMNRGAEMINAGQKEGSLKGFGKVALGIAEAGAGTIVGAGEVALAPITPIVKNVLSPENYKTNTVLPANLKIPKAPTTPEEKATYAKAHPAISAIATKLDDLVKAYPEVANTASDIFNAALYFVGAGEGEAPLKNAITKESLADAKESLVTDINKIPTPEELGKKATELVTPKPTDVNKVTGEIIQGKVEDIAKGKTALSQIDISKVKTYKDLGATLDKKIADDSTALDATLETNKTVKKLNDLSLKEKAGKMTVSHNYVKDAIAQLKEHYTAINDNVALAKIQATEAKAVKDGLTVKEINDIAKEHGQAINAFNANGQAASGLTKQAAENTRMGLKNTARDIFGDKAYKAADEQISATIRTRDLVNKIEEDVNKLQQKIKERSLGEKAGRLVGEVVNLIGVGGPKGLVEYFLGRGTGLKTLNALDLEAVLSKNLKNLQKALKDNATPAEIENDLNEILTPTSGALPVESLKVKGETPLTKQNFPRDTKLTGEDAVVQEKAIDYVLNNEDKIMSSYKAKYGKVINADNFRPFFTDIGYNGDNAAAIQEAASYLAKKARTQALDNPGEYVVGTAGGSGAGKTSAMANNPFLKQIHENSAMILDSNFSSYSSAKKFLAEVASKGKSFTGIFTYRDFMDAIENGIIKRMLTNPEEMGRVVPTKIAAGNHFNSWEVVKKLVRDDKVDFHFVDNSLGAGKSKVVSLDELDKKINYTSKEQMTKEANDKIKELYETQKPFIDSNGIEHFITKKQYEALIK